MNLGTVVVSNVNGYPGYKALCGRRPLERLQSRTQQPAWIMRNLPSGFWQSFETTGFAKTEASRQSFPGQCGLLNR
jgi:hypothetical protein